MLAQRLEALGWKGPKEWQAPEEKRSDSRSWGHGTWAGRPFKRIFGYRIFHPAMEEAIRARKSLCNAVLITPDSKLDKSLQLTYYSRRNMGESSDQNEENE